MRHFEFITEGAPHPSFIEKWKPFLDHYELEYTQENTDLLEFLGMIKRDCQPYLNILGDKVFGMAMTGLYRGITGNLVGKFLAKKARLADRIPRDLAIDVHEHINNWFTEAYGKPWRNAIFCTGSIAEANEYGHLYQIFPLGDFEYLWSPDIVDLMRTVSGSGLVHVDKNIMIPQDHKPTDPALIDQFIEQELAGKYTSSNLLTALRGKNEIMLWCDRYYAIRTSAVFSPSQKAAAAAILRDKK